MEPLPKLISKIKQWHPRCFLVGFKLLVNSTRNELMEAAAKSFQKNGCDMIVANDLSDIQNNNHQLLLMSADGRMVVRNKWDIPDDPNYLAQQVVEVIEQWYCPRFSLASQEVSQPS
jgi:phosphopantothenate-cysteine ligase